MMYDLTEQQRTDAIASCDRILEASAKMQQALENIVKIFDNVAHGRDPNDGVKK